MASKGLTSGEVDRPWEDSDPRTSRANTTTLPFWLQRVGPQGWVSVCDAPYTSSFMFSFSRRISCASTVCCAEMHKDIDRPDLVKKDPSSDNSEKFDIKTKQSET